MEPIPPTPIAKPLPLSYAAADRKSFFKRRSTRWILAAVFVALLVPVGGFIYFRFFWSLNLNLGPRAISAVSQSQWNHLSVGMTEAQVVTLLGRSDSQAGGGTMTVNGQAQQVTPKFWEYNWTDGLPLFGPSPKAYVVYFDNNGRVSAWRTPSGLTTTQPTTLPASSTTP